MASTELDLAALEAQLLTALKAGDQLEQIRLYRLAGEHHLASGEIDEGCFLLTNAWVLALAAGDPVEAGLHDMLARHGRVP
ncbi:MAG: hypothetical protein ACPGSC_09335, partial [Granulosicoccaceae bacterium]